MPAQLPLYQQVFQQISTSTSLRRLALLLTGIWRPRLPSWPRWPRNCWPLGSLKPPARRASSAGCAAPSMIPPCGQRPATSPSCAGSSPGRPSAKAGSTSSSSWMKAAKRPKSTSFGSAYLIGAAASLWPGPSGCRINPRKKGITGPPWMVSWPRWQPCCPMGWRWCSWLTELMITLLFWTGFGPKVGTLLSAARPRAACGLGIGGVGKGPWPNGSAKGFLPQDGALKPKAGCTKRQGGGLSAWWPCGPLASQGPW
jgi:hypothetical protein